MQVLRNICSSEGTCVDTCVQLLSETLSDNGTIQQVDMAGKSAPHYTCDV